MDEATRARKIVAWRHAVRRTLSGPMKPQRRFSFSCYTQFAVFARLDRAIQ
jgi:hypothetical protein